MAGCEKCKKGTYLERFNGQLFCPKCGFVVESKPLCVNKENEDIIRLSELCYLRYLLPQEERVQVKVTSDRRAQLLEDAKHLCSEAAAKGHPVAVFRLGYYNECYSRGASNCIRVALDCYRRLCDESGITDYAQLSPDNYTSATLPDPKAYKELQRQAARRLVGLFARYPYILKDRNEEKQSVNSFENIRNRVASKYNLSIGGEAKKSVESREDEICQTLASCMSQTGRSPFFGAFLIDREFMQKLIAGGVKGNGKDYPFSELAKHLRLSWTEANRFGIVPDDAIFDNVANNVSAVSDLSEAAEYFYLRFINTGMKSPYIRDKDKTKFVKGVGAYTLIDVIRETPGVDLMVYGDDIVYYSLHGGRRKDIARCVSKTLSDFCDMSMGAEEA